MVFRPMVQLVQDGPMREVLLTDMAHSKDALYTRQHGMVVGQDADNKMSIVAWGLYPIESTEYYEEILINMKRVKDMDKAVFLAMASRASHWR